MKLDKTYVKAFKNVGIVFFQGGATMFYVGVVLELILIFYFIFFKLKDAYMIRIWKSLASIGFVVLGLYVFSMQSSTYGILILLGLILGCLGDYFLAMQRCDEKRKKVYFIVGLCAFALGHIAYATAFFKQDVTLLMLMVLLCVLLSVITVAILQKLKLNFKEMKIAVLFYCAVIYFMEIQALFYLLDLTVSGIVLNIGTLLFVLSDLILAFIYFGNKNTQFMNRLNLSCYYLAQVGIVMHLYFSIA